MSKFRVVSAYAPAGDQPKAIAQLEDGLQKKYRFQTLWGVTGSGKTFTMANLISKVQRPTLVMSPNKTLAAQLCNELREFLPHNAVEYFVSYYDYYQPEAYIPSTDTYIEKSSAINDDIDRLRHSATRSLLERRDVVVVASVSCIYGLGMPEEYLASSIPVEPGQTLNRNGFLRQLVAGLYERNDVELMPGRFRVRGDVVEVFPAYEDRLIRVEFFGDEVERIAEIQPLTGEINATLKKVVIYPAKHFITPQDKKETALKAIEAELQERVEELKGQNKLLEAQRIFQRTRYDMEMIREIGYCQGIENYSRHLSGRKAGDPPATLLDYFPEDFLTIIDESHVTIPQIQGMFNGDQARKQVLVDYGFRLPSAKDNRPLRIEEFWQKTNQAVFVSATPAAFESDNSSQIVEQVIRPTGLLDPILEVRPITHQVDDLLKEIKLRVEKKERVLVLTLTKKMAEDLTQYLLEFSIHVNYLHSEVHTLDRIDILRSLRKGEFDVVVGVNLLREGLDLPEVSLVAILDADKEGYLRSESSLIQMIGRAARNANGTVLLYADRMTRSMEKALEITRNRRALQEKFNEKHGITPKTIIKSTESSILDSLTASEDEVMDKMHSKEAMSAKELPKTLKTLEKAMKAAAKALDFEEAALLRDKIREIREKTHAKK